MENQVQENKWQIIAKFGLIYALLSVGLSLVSFITGTQMSLKYLNSLANFLIVFGTMYMWMKAIKMELNGGFISYGQAFISGILISVAASVLLAIYFYVYLTFIDVDFVENMTIESKRQLIESGASEDEIEAQMKVMSYVKSPWVMTFGGFLGNFFYGFVASLIMAFFVKREDPDSAYKSLEE